MNPFPTSQWGPMLLLRAVREVADGANVEEPTRITQRRWDAARAQHELWQYAPPARRITERLGLGWSRTLEAAYTDVTSPATAYANMARSHERGWLLADYSRFALQLVAGRLGLATLREHEYETERDVVLGADARRYRHGRQLRLPTGDQVRAVAGSWEQALIDAGLEPAEPQPEHRAPTVVELLDRCYAVYGTQPSCAELRAFAKGNGIPFPIFYDKWLDLVAAWKQTLRDRGLPVPDGLPPRAERPDYGADVGAALTGERRRSDRSDRDACVAWVVRYLTDPGRAARPGSDDYRSFCRRNPGAPPVERLVQHGGWSAVRRDAEQRLLAGTASTS